MTSIQRIIKYFATAFALFLIVAIISGILGGVYAIAAIFDLKKDNQILSEQMNGTYFESGNITELDIEVAYATLTIKQGDALTVETNSSNINCKQSNKTLKITEGSYNWFSKNEDSTLIVYIPQGMNFEKVKINTGAGKVNIHDLTTQKLSFELGAGAIEINNLNVLNSAEIDGGAGKIEINSGTINNLDLDMGIGEANIITTLVGKSKLNAGIGALNVNVQANKENYKVNVDKGIGSIKVNGAEALDGSWFGNGNNLIEIDGGIGTINVNFDA